MFWNLPISSSLFTFLLASGPFRGINTNKAKENEKEKVLKKKKKKKKQKQKQNTY